MNGALLLLHVFVGAALVAHAMQKLLVFRVAGTAAYLASFRFRAPRLMAFAVIGTEFVGDDTNPSGTVAMFQLQGGLILAVWPRTELAKDATIQPGPANSGEFSIGHAVADKAAVDALLAQAEAAGASLTAPPHDRPWGIYSGYFRDPDGHLWEILWNPALDLEGS